MLVDGSLLIGWRQHKTLQARSAEGLSLGSVSNQTFVSRDDEPVFTCLREVGDPLDVLGMSTAR